jgi:general stress protein YciG
MAEKRPRGFAAMNAEQQRAIARLGGRAAHEKGTAHEFTREEAAQAGRKGGRAAHAKGTAHKWTSQEATEAGRKGGQAHARRPQPSRPPGPAQENERAELPSPLEESAVLIRNQEAFFLSHR